MFVQSRDRIGISFGRLFWRLFCRSILFAFGFCSLVFCEKPIANFDQGKSSVDVGALPPGLTLSADSCKNCHASDFDDWKHSIHGQAWVDPLFQDSFKIEPAVWCVNCHAPLAQQAYPSNPKQPGIIDRTVQQSQETEKLRNEGVNCATCHIRDGSILAARKDRLTESSKYHPVKYDSKLRSAEFCAGCHQFNFPYFDTNVAVHMGPSPMQNTYEDWSKSVASYAGITCQDCHGSPNNHKVYGPHTPGWLEGKISLEARFDSESTKEKPIVKVFLTLRGIPHSFPTGDLFRGVGVEVLSGETILGKINYGRKTGDTLDSSAPGGIYKRFIQENVLYPDRFNPMIAEVIQIPLVRSVNAQERLQCRITYYFRNKEAENPLREKHLLNKVIAQVEVSDRRHQSSR